MPNTKQAKKRMRQNVKQRLANRSRKTAVKTATRKVTKALDDKKVGEAEEGYREMQSKVDKAAKSNTIHRNKAARRKSRMQKKINALKGAKKS